MNRLALALLILSAVFYGVFMVVRVDGEDRGWSAWVEVADHLSSGDWQTEEARSHDNLLMGGFVVTSFLAVGGPLLFPLARRSRACWWVMMTLASCATVTTGLLLYFTIVDEYPAGLWWLGAALFAHLGGLVCVRGTRKELPA
ncbi:hypothetical protein [Luteolibacter sp. LG18]|uniref:hypothetical protein n=1 Tax=Luteolibacter sp. LG18 TaxID=2819286 RepID=UPI002B2D5C96|nr:hypothetical protein llg_18870 [Luteolibacter sp. LG18]